MDHEITSQITTLEELFNLKYSFIQEGEESLSIIDFLMENGFYDQVLTLLNINHPTSNRDEELIKSICYLNKGYFTCSLQVLKEFKESIVSFDSALIIKLEAYLSTLVFELAYELVDKISSCQKQVMGELAQFIYMLEHIVHIDNQEILSFYAETKYLSNNYIKGLLCLKANKTNDFEFLLKTFFETNSIDFKYAFKKRYSFLGHTSTKCFLRKSSQPSVDINIFNGTFGPKQCFAPFTIIYRLFHILISEEARPKNLGVIYEAIFRGDNFNKYALNKLRTAVYRLNSIFDKSEIPLEVFSRKKTYHLNILGPINLLQNEIYCLYLDHFLSYFILVSPAITFTTKDLCRDLNLNKKQVLNGLNQLVAENFIKKIGHGPKVRYEKVTNEPRLN